MTKRQGPARSRLLSFQMGYFTTNPQIEGVFMRLRLMLVALPAAVACSPIPSYQCPSCLGSVVVLGQVSAPDARPLRSATVILSANRLDEAWGRVATKTDAAGFYRVDVPTSPQPGYGRVDLRVLPPAGSGLRDTVVYSPIVRVGMTPPDTARVDIRLTAATP